MRIANALAKSGQFDKAMQVAQMMPVEPSRPSVLGSIALLLATEQVTQGKSTPSKAVERRMKSEFTPAETQLAQRLSQAFSETVAVLQSPRQETIRSLRDLKAKITQDEQGEVTEVSCFFTKVTDAGIAELQQALPNCKIWKPNGAINN